MIPRGLHTRTKTDLRLLLERWFRDTSDETIGRSPSFGGVAWVFLDFPDLPRPARLNADTTRSAVRDFLDDSSRRGAEVPWVVIANQRGPINKVVYGEDGRAAAGWYCFLI